MRRADGLVSKRGLSLSGTDSRASVRHEIISYVFT